MRILLVEDNVRLAHLVSSNLERTGFTVDTLGTIEDAGAALASTGYAAVVLDLGLPDGDGLHLLKAIRARTKVLPVLILTARDGIDDRVEGLNAGADDYLPKPFDHQELMARLRAILRRTADTEAGSVLVHGDLSFHTGLRELRLNGEVLPLPLGEGDLIELLMRRPNQVVTKQAIEAALQATGADLSANAVEARVYRLRKRLEAAGSRVAIHTVRGLGYMLPEGTT